MHYVNLTENTTFNLHIEMKTKLFGSKTRHNLTSLLQNRSQSHHHIYLYGEVLGWNGADLLSSVFVSSHLDWNCCDRPQEVKSVWKQKPHVCTIMLAHLERRSVWVPHVTFTLPPNDTFSLCDCWNRFWAVFFSGKRPGTRYECPLYSFLWQHQWVMTECMKLIWDDADK